MQAVHVYLASWVCGGALLGVALLLRKKSTSPVASTPAQVDAAPPPLPPTAQLAPAPTELGPSQGEGAPPPQALRVELAPTSVELAPTQVEVGFRAAALGLIGCGLGGLLWSALALGSQSWGALAALTLGTLFATLPWRAARTSPVSRAVTPS